MSDFPSSKFERSKLFAKAGLKAGKNYAGHYLRHPLNPNGTNFGDNLSFTFPYYKEKSHQS
jgi:hypothetical protein